MTKGTAHRFRFGAMSQYSDLLIALRPNEAIVGGALRPDLPDTVEVVTKRNLNGTARPAVIARSKEYINYRPGQPALAPIDFDLKDMPPTVAGAMDAHGGLWPALVSACPPLANVARIERASTSAGLFHALTGEPFNGSGGRHVYVLVADGSDIERFLKALHERCWLVDLGWMIVGAAGQLLERSVVDRAVGTPERLMFEGPPVLVDPIAQDLALRQPFIVEGKALDTVVACPPLGSVQQAELGERRAKERHRLAGDCARARERFADRQSRRLANRTGMEIRRARRTIERQCDGVLLPDVLLPFDDQELEGKTVADVLANPTEFEGETLADPIEGPEYGPCKAKTMRRADGSVWIHSFAHGGATYELRQDYAAVKAALEKTVKDDIVDAFIGLVLAADLTAAEIDQLKQIAAARCDVGVRVLAATLKAAHQQQAAARRRQEHDRRIAERRDPRPLLGVPAADSEYGPVMISLNAVVGRDHPPERPTRNPNKVVAMAREIRVPSLHALTSMETNLGDNPDQPPAGPGATDPEASQ
jgi:hypothetical protein